MEIHGILKIFTSIFEQVHEQVSALSLTTQVQKIKITHINEDEDIAIST